MFVYIIPLWCLQESDASETTEGLSREELGRLVASRWTGESTENQGGTKADTDDIHEETPKDEHDEEEYDNYASDSDEDAAKYEDDINDDVEDELDESYEEENYDDTTSYKDDFNDELYLPGLQFFSGQYFFKLGYCNH